MNLQAEKKWKWIWGLVLAAAWTGVILLFIHSQGNLSVSGLLSYKPDSTPLAVLAMLGLFLLKSVDFLLHSGVLYAANGIMFPLPAAVLLNVLGAAIMMTTPYLIGRTLGPPLVARLREKYPKLRVFEKLRLSNDFVVALLLRVTGIPINPASLYMGAMEFDFGKYLLGSLTGLLPIIVDYTALGTGAEEPSSPVFLGALIAKVLITLTSIGVYALLLRRSNAKENGK